MQMKYKDIKTLREQLYEEQNGICALCSTKMDINDTALDHCHKTGFIRAVLHRQCNRYLGRLENNRKRYKITDEMFLTIAPTAALYCLKLRTEIHPTFNKKRKK